MRVIPPEIEEYNFPKEARKEFTAYSVGILIIVFVSFVVLGSLVVYFVKFMFTR